MTVIFLTDKNNKPNAFGKGYLLWFYSMQGPTFKIVRRRGD